MNVRKLWLLAIMVAILLLKYIPFIKPLANVSKQSFVDLIKICGNPLFGLAPNCDTIKIINLIIWVSTFSLLLWFLLDNFNYLFKNRGKIVKTKEGYGEESLLCPRCKIHMKKLKKSDVIIDICAKCGGMWTDAGELEKLAKIIKT